MRTLVLHISLLFFINSISSQTVLEKIFNTIPITIIDSIDTNVREKLVEKYHKDNKILYKLSNSNKLYEKRTELEHQNNESKILTQISLLEFSSKKGFLKLKETHLNSESGAIFEMVYWNVSDTSKLICTKEFRTECCGPAEDELNFYKFDSNNELKKIKTSLLIPELKLSDVLNTKKIKDDGFKLDEISKIYSKPLQSFYKLPISGKDIVFPITFFEDYLDNDELKILNRFKKYYYKQIIYVWNDGSFILKKN